MAGLLQTVREALTALDALDPVCPDATQRNGMVVEGWGNFEMQVVRGHRESRHLSEAVPMEKLSSF